MIKFAVLISLLIVIGVIVMFAPTTIMCTTYTPKGDGAQVQQDDPRLCRPTHIYEPEYWGYHIDESLMLTAADDMLSKARSIWKNAKSGRYLGK